MKYHKPPLPIILFGIVAYGFVGQPFSKQLYTDFEQPGAGNKWLHFAVSYMTHVWSIQDGGQLYIYVVSSVHFISPYDITLVLEISGKEILLVKRRINGFQ